MKEDEARKKWCPFSRVGDVNLGGTTNTHGNETACIASDCAAWRENGPVVIFGRVLDPDGGGYCGLAGKE